MPSSNIEAAEVPVTKLCQLLEEFIVAKSIDLGSTILHVGQHVHLGPMVLVSTICGRAASIRT